MSTLTPVLDTGRGPRARGWGQLGAIAATAIASTAFLVGALFYGRSPNTDAGPESGHRGAKLVTRHRRSS